MKILQISTQDIGGGAEKVAYNLFSAYQARGYETWLSVGYQKERAKNVFQIPKYELPARTKPFLQVRNWLREQNQRIPGTWRLSNLLNLVVDPQKHWVHHWGIEDFNYPNSRRVLELVPHRPDIVHTHNLHGAYFDLRYLSVLSKNLPTILTLHDEWMLTGHCAYTLECRRWEQGCGSCPDLRRPKAIERDATAYNWRRKRRIYTQSNLYIATPSQWLMDRVQHSMLIPIEGRVINNGVNLATYYPANRPEVRTLLELPKDAIIMLFASFNVKGSPFKDYVTIEKAIHYLDRFDFKGAQIMLIALGSNEPNDEVVGKIKIKHVGFQSDPLIVAQYFQAADIYLHAARAENFPNTILEAMACGTPVIATTVGGIPEQVDEGLTGFLTPPGDAAAMATRIEQLVVDQPLRWRMGEQAAETARRRYDLQRQADEYLGWYQEILSQFPKSAFPNQKSKHALSNPE
jgi:glycosyltransferase involved in cell wall biosynthesis